MSCFPGRMKEYNEVSLDRFDAENLQSTVYFLSHKHEDHMQGLSSSSFKYRLEGNCHIKLYCSEVTRDLLLADHRFTFLSRSIVALPVDAPFILKVPDKVSGKEKYEVTVTPLHAAHCPGSVMFLFEGDQGTVIYTGDFRLNRTDLQAMSALHSLSRVKHVDTLYMDTTFCVPEALFIPSREESTEAVLMLTKNWLQQGDDHYVVLRCSAGIGYEQLFIRLAQELDTKVHVNEEKQKEYEKVSVFPSFSTADPSATRLHSCSWTKKRPEASRLPCGHLPGGHLPGGDKKMEVRTIMLSTMWFTQQASLDSVYSARKAPYYYRVCYSFHSSYSELRDMALYLKPAALRPNVIPYKEKDFSAVQARLNHFQKLACQSVPTTSESQPKELGLQRKRKRKNKPSQSDGSEGMDWGDLSPAKKAKGSQELTFTVNYDNVSQMSVSPAKSSQVSRSEASGQSEEEDGSDVDLFEDLEDDEYVKQVRDSFKPIHDGSYGSYVSYISDMSDDEEAAQDVPDAATKDVADVIKGVAKDSGGEDVADDAAKNVAEYVTDATKDVEQDGADNVAQDIAIANLVPEAGDSLPPAGNAAEAKASSKDTASSEQNENEHNEIIKSNDLSNATEDLEPALENVPSTDNGVIVNFQSEKSEQGDAVPNGKVQMVEQGITVSKDITGHVKTTTQTDKDCNAVLPQAGIEKGQCSTDSAGKVPENIISMDATVDGHNGKSDSSDKLVDDSSDVEEIVEEQDVSCDSNDVQEIGHESGDGQDESYESECLLDGSDAVIDLTEEDDVQDDIHDVLHDDCESESLFSSEEEGEVSLEQLQAQSRGRCFIGPHGVLYEDEDVSGSDTGEEWESDCEEIIISSDDEVSDKQSSENTKQTARKSTAKPSNSVENGASRSQEQDESIIVLEDSMDGSMLKADGDSINGKAEACHSESPVVFGLLDNQGPSDCSDAELNKMLVLTSEALSKKLDAARQINERNHAATAENSENNTDNCVEADKGSGAMNHPSIPSIE